MVALEIISFDEAGWETLRRLRLSALGDSPDSYGPTLASAEAQPEDYWRRWAAGRPGRMQAWAAFEGEEPVALISAGVPEDGTAHFGALWVAPSARGDGLGRNLVEIVIAWAHAQKCSALELEVTDGNPAERLYETMGFRRTGARKALREGSLLEEVTMRLELQYPVP